MEKKVLVLALVVILSLSLVRGGAWGETKREKSHSSGTSARANPALRFKTFSYIDQPGIGIEAFRMLIPVTWQFEGGIKWVLDNPGMPAVASFRVRNPQGTEELEVFPNQPFFWTDNRMVLSMFPVGSRYFGNEVLPPVNALEALKGIVVPRFRGRAGLAVISEQLLPDLARALGSKNQPQPGLSQTADGAKIRIEYDWNGKRMEEEIYGLVETYSFSLSTMNGPVTNTNWMADYLFSFKAEKGKLDRQAKLFQTMIYSFRLNPQWFSKYNQVIGFLAQQQIQRIQNTGQLSRIISQTSNEISDMMMDSYNQRQAVYDHISTDFSQYVRGVDEYYNPVEQKPVELPSGYNQAWCNSLGEYVVSDDPFFNPNLGSNQNWQKLEKK